MSLRVTISHVTVVSDGIWIAEMPPHNVLQLGTPPEAIGARSVVLLSKCEFDKTTREISFTLDDAVPLNVGTSTVVILLGSQKIINQKITDNLETGQTQNFGKGDLGFIALAERELSPRMSSVAKKLLAGVRENSPGDLKRGQSRNFSETPDNFWYVIIQPRIDQISITVRGSVSHFDGISKLETKDDRGNTRFKVCNENDISEALKLIFHAFRKK